MRNIKSLMMTGLVIITGAIALASLYSSPSLAFDDNDILIVDPNNAPNNAIITYDRSNPTDFVNTKEKIKHPLSELIAKAD